MNIVICRPFKVHVGCNVKLVFYWSVEVKLKMQIDRKITSMIQAT